MKLIAVAVRDRAMNAYMRPFFVPATGAAIRSFGDEINRAADDNPMHNHPDDYDLYELGTFDEETGLLQPTEMPKQLAIGKQLSLKRVES